MKRFLAAILLFAGPAFAIDPFTVNRSSFIAGTNQTGCIQASYLDKVLPGATSTGGSITIHNSSWTLTSPVISSTTLAAGNMQDFANTRVAGICYNASTPTNGVTIQYKK